MSGDSLIMTGRKIINKAGPEKIIKPEKIESRPGKKYNKPEKQYVATDKYKKKDGRPETNK